MIEAEPREKKNSRLPIKEGMTAESNAALGKANDSASQQKQRSSTNVLSQQGSAIVLASVPAAKQHRPRLKVD
jgi:hypothetical protein